MLTLVLDIAIPVLASLSILVALFFILRAAQDRTKSTRAAYGVGRQEARQTMQVDVVRGMAAFFVGLILFGVYGLSSRPGEVEPGITPTHSIPAVETPVAMPTFTRLPQGTATNTAVAIPTLAVPPSPTTQIILPTATVFLPPTETPTTTPPTATVSEPNGVYLRSAPSTISEQLEWLLQGTVVFVLEGQETADGFTWQQVRTAEGLEGWVAVDFITYNQ